VKVLSFCAVGAGSTIAYGALYLLLRIWLSPAIANLAALTLCVGFNTEANRRWTFRASSGGTGVRLHTQAGVLFVANYLFTTGAVLGVKLLDPDIGQAMELPTLVAAYLVMTVLRFVALDRWVFVRANSPVVPHQRRPR
jgi:putative flippase GtrA